MLLPSTGHFIWLILFFWECPIPNGGQVCSTGVSPMAMNGNPNKSPHEFSHPWPGIEHTWPSMGSMELTWLVLRRNGNPVREIFDHCDLRQATNASAASRQLLDPAHVSIVFAIWWKGFVKAVGIIGWKAEI